MIPLRDHNPSERTPIVTWALLALNIGIFLSYYPALSGSERALLGFYGIWALVPAEISQGIEYSTLFSYMFLHGGWMHLIGNMLFLYIFGDNLEDQLGHIGFLLFYLICGVAAGYGQVLAGPYSTVPTVGASGAIAGVMGGYLVFFPRARVDLLLILFVFIKVITIPAWLLLGLWFALQIANGAASDASGGGVAYWAHAGGFVAGVLLILPAWLRRGGAAFWQQSHGAPPHPERKAPKSRWEGEDGPILTLRREEDTLSQSRVPNAGGRRFGTSRPPEVPPPPPPPRSPWGGRKS